VEKGADGWKRMRTGGIVCKFLSRIWLRARIVSSRADRIQIVPSHCSQNTCLGTDGWDIGRWPERVRARMGAGMGQAHVAMGTRGV
jgi:hypothetical protein